MRVARKATGWLACLALAIGGCHAPPAMMPTKCICTPNGPCGGYFSTCWRQWPAECVSCPPMVEASEAPKPAAPAAGSEAVPPPPPRLRDMPDDLPPAMPDDLPPDMLDESGVPESGSRPRRRPVPHAAAPSGERRRAPQTITPRRAVKLASPASDEPVVYRRTTVELLPPTEAGSKARLLTPPSFSRDGRADGARTPRSRTSVPTRPDGS